MPRPANGVEASHQHHCPACEHPSWCVLFPDGAANCYRVESDLERTDAQGALYWYHPPTGSASAAAERPRPIQQGNGPTRGTTDQLDRVYRELQQQLTLSADHERHLVARGLSKKAITAFGFRSMNASAAVRANIATRISELFPFWQNVPGLVARDGKPRLTAQSGLLLFNQDMSGRITGVQVRADDATLAKVPDHPRYLWLSSGKQSGPKALACPAWWPPSCGDRAGKVVRITEGAMKAAVAAELTGIPAISAGAGVGSMASPEILDWVGELGPDLVLLAPDQDAFIKPEVAQRVKAVLARLSTLAVGLCFELKVEVWTMELPAQERPKGIDDALAAGCELQRLEPGEYLSLLSGRPTPPNPCDKGIDDALQDGLSIQEISPEELLAMSEPVLPTSSPPFLVEPESQSGKATPASLLEQALLLLNAPGGFKPADRNRFAPHVQTVTEGKKLGGQERKRVFKVLSRYSDTLHQLGINVNDVADQERELEHQAGNGDESKAESNQVGKLLALARDWKWLKSEGQSYAAITESNPDGSTRRETLRFTRGGVRKRLQSRFLEEHHTCASSEALTQVYGALEAKAESEGIDTRVWLRTAYENDRIYVDLCDQLGRVVEISDGGWKVTTDPPVYFSRNPGMQALPLPERGGSVAELRPFLNCQTDEQFILAVAWLVHAVFPLYPHPVLVLEGCQGTGKSSLLRLLRSLVDPHSMPFRKAPKSEEDVAMGAFNNWVLAYDNLSKIDDWLSDSLCGVATGSGFAKRRLYSDDEESSVTFLRPVVISGLLGLNGKTDLADRVLKVTLAPIPESARRLESELTDDGQWEKARPRILGALFEALSVALRNKGKKRLSHLPRLADFAQFIVDGEDALPWEPGAFIRAFRQAKTDQIEALLELDPLAAAVRILVDLNGHWEGTATDLLERLAKLTTDGPRALPNRIKLQSRLRLLEPNLRTVGIEIAFERLTAGRKIVLQKVTHKKHNTPPVDGGGKQPSQPSQLSQTANSLGLEYDSSTGSTVIDRHSTVIGAPETRSNDSSNRQPSYQPSYEKPLFHGKNDSYDAYDSKNHPCSGEGETQKKEGGWLPSDVRQAGDLF